MTLQTAGSVLYFIYGSNFTESSVVTIEGIPTSTSYQGPGLLWAIPNLQAPVGPGTYAVTVSNGAGTSNAASTTVYAPPLGPQAFAVVPSYFLYGTGTNAIAIADVDGDGYGDVIVNGPGATVTIFPGQADGTLGTPRTVPAIAGSAIAAGDVTGNGSPDIITLVYPADPSNGDASAFTVLLNDGTGNFLVGPTVSFAGAYPGPVLFADVLGTGRNDLLVAVEDPTVIYLFPNLGAGNFGSPTVLAALGPSRSFAVADFNGDGRPDIAYANQDAVSTHLLINQGNGRFNDVAPSSLQSANGSVVAGDFNGDGLPDLAVASASTLQTFLNQGNLIFSPVLQTTPVAAGSLVVGDFDGDGVLDMAAPGGDVYPHGALILWGDDSGVFAPENIAGPGGFTIAAGDLNGDGITDIVTQDLAGLISVILGRKGREFPEPTPLFFESGDLLQIGDFNGDGKPDIYMTGYSDESGDVYPGVIFLNQGNGAFEPAGYPTASAQAVADLTGNGKLDLIGFTGSGLQIWPGTGDLNYDVAAITIPTPIGVSFAGFRTADLDNDGLPEIVGNSGILWNNGNFQFDFVALNNAGVEVFGIADVNGDGRLDLITQGGTFLNQGSREFTQVTQNGLALSAGSQLAIGDFDGNGILDAATLETATAAVFVFTGNGDGTFVQQDVLGVNPDGTGYIDGIVAGDFSGTGRSQILGNLSASDTLVLFTYLPSQEEFAASFFAPGTGGVAGIGVADFNGDGKSDLAVAAPQFISVPIPFLVVLFGQ